MKNGNCKNCIYSGKCYQEKCYTQMQSVCNDYKERNNMKILATATHEMGGEFKLVKISNDFYMYGTQQEFNSLLGVSVDRCGTLEKVLNHCLSIADLCQKNIEKYLAEKSKSQNPNGWQILIDCEQSEKDMLLYFAKVLKSI